VAETAGSGGWRPVAAAGQGPGPGGSPRGPTGAPPEPGPAPGAQGSRPGPEARGGGPGKGLAREILETVLAALVVALLVRTFVVQVYVVDGDSMLPNLHHGDRLLVNKFIYRLRPPRPGEIIVFHLPELSARPFIKRVIAVAGDRVEIREGVVFVNDRPLAENYGPHLDDRSYPPVVVPPGTVWVLGDNRPVSSDSRLIGPVPLDRIEGEAFFRFWPPGDWGTLGPPPQPAAAVGD